MVDRPAITVRQRLAVVIARQDAERGRPLTDREKLENLAAALAEDADTPCPLCSMGRLITSSERCHGPQGL